MEIQVGFTISVQTRYPPNHRLVYKIAKFALQNLKKNFKMFYENQNYKYLCFVFTSNQYSNSISATFLFSEVHAPPNFFSLNH